VCGQNRSGDRRVSPVALHLRIEAEPAAGASRNLQPDSQFAGAARASGACYWHVQELSHNRCEEPEIEQKRPEHPKTLKHAHGVFWIEPDKHDSQDNYQEPSQAASNQQLQLEVFPNTHFPIVRARALIRFLSHVGDVTSWRQG